MLRDVVWHSQEAQTVANIWAAYARREPSARTSEALLDVLKEVNPLTPADTEAEWLSGIFARRAWVDIKAPVVGIARGEESRTFIPSYRWGECLAEAPKLDFRSKKLLRDFGFKEVACLLGKKSSVTGNFIIDDERHWPL